MLKCPEMVKCTKWMDRFVDGKMLFNIIGAVSKNAKKQAIYFFQITPTYFFCDTLNYLACEILKAASCSKTNANFKLLVVRTLGWDLLSHF